MRRSPQQSTTNCGCSRKLAATRSASSPLAIPPLSSRSPGGRPTVPRCLVDREPPPAPARRWAWRTRRGGAVSSASRSGIEPALLLERARGSRPARSSRGGWRRPGPPLRCPGLGRGGDEAAHQRGRRDRSSSDPRFNRESSLSVRGTARGAGAPRAGGCEPGRRPRRGLARRRRSRSPMPPKQPKLWRDSRTRSRLRGDDGGRGGAGVGVGVDDRERAGTRTIIPVTRVVGEHGRGLLRCCGLEEAFAARAAERCLAVRLLRLRCRRPCRSPLSAGSLPVAIWAKTADPEDRRKARSAGPGPVSALGAARSRARSSLRLAASRRCWSRSCVHVGHDRAASRSAPLRIG